MRFKMFAWLFVLLACAFSASAALTATVSRPAASNSVSGIYEVNVTTSSNVSWCAVWASSASTANSTAVMLFNQSNATAVNNMLINNSVWDSTALEDSNDYTFYAKCANSTDTNATSASVDGVIIDNTVPTASISNTAGSVLVLGSTLTATVAGANSTSCKVLFGSNAYSGTSSGNTCTYTLSSAVPDGIYTVVIRATDGTNYTNSVGVSLQVDVLEEADTALTEQQIRNVLPQIQTKKVSPVVWLVLIIAGIYFLSEQKKRRR